MYKIINRKKLVATALADMLGKIIFLPRTLLVKRELINPEAIKKICVIRTAYIGDVVMTLPLLPALRRRFPVAKITFLTSTTAAPLLRYNPHVDEVLTFDPFWFYRNSIREWLRCIKRLWHCSFDLVIEARGDIRDIALIAFWMRAKYKVSYDVGGGGYLLTHVIPYPGPCHKVDYHCNIANYLGAATERLDEKIYLGPMDRDFASGLLAGKGINGPFIAIHPGSRLTLKRWFPERFAELSDQLSTRYRLPLVLLGAQQEKELLLRIQKLARNRIVPIMEPLELRQMAAILEQASVFVCNDSAPMHIAAAMQSPTVAIFGPSKSGETAPYSLKSEVVEKNFPCRFSCDEGICRHREHHDCLKQVTVADVLAAVSRLLGEEPRPSLPSWRLAPPA
ncbi:MAG: hypothetical protein BWK76_09305 [Desulfobulbaceae bacterium A2]|nr:MAG: hypothetical protein BWK76_09305 [Desulfobulbaceae bacterium A2]